MVESGTLALLCQVSKRLVGLVRNVHRPLKLLAQAEGPRWMAIKSTPQLD